jgi:hypothetical protein
MIMDVVLRKRLFEHIHKCRENDTYRFRLMGRSSIAHPCAVELLYLLREVSMNDLVFKPRELRNQSTGCRPREDLIL